MRVDPKVYIRVHSQLLQDAQDIAVVMNGAGDSAASAGSARVRHFGPCCPCPQISHRHSRLGAMRSKPDGSWARYVTTLVGARTVAHGTQSTCKQRCRLDSIPPSQLTATLVRQPASERVDALRHRRNMVCASPEPLLTCTLLSFGTQTLAQPAQLPLEAPS